MTRKDTVGSIYRYLIHQLSLAEIENPQLEARILLAHAAEIDQTRIIGYPEDKLDKYTIKYLNKIITRRKNYEPIAYITGTKEFWSLDFEVTHKTLIPRPDSEILIEFILGSITNYNEDLSILDLGTGSGCLLLALLSELPNANGTGIDISPSACGIARRNARKLGLDNRAKFYQGNWMENVQHQFDIIVSNPPYIAEPDIKFLDKDVMLFEPHLALSGGPDGLSAYRVIAKECITCLKQSGILAVEIGISQAQNICNIFARNGLIITKIQRDLSNIERCILATVEQSKKISAIKV